MDWKKKDGAQIVVNLHLRTSLGTNGGVIGYEGIALDITERKRAEEALRSLSRQLLELQEAERRRLARELHDEIGQALAALKINLQTAQRTASLYASRLRDSIGIVDTIMEQVRDLCLTLHPPQLDDLGLAAILEWYVDRQAQRAGLVAHVAMDPCEPRPSPAIETACLRVVQEALTNITRHAQARRVWVELRSQHRILHLRIRDDGIGFDSEAARQQAARGMSMGLLGMEERVRLVSGQLEIRATPGRGTEIRVDFPLHHQAAAPQ